MTDPTEMVRSYYQLVDVRDLAGLLDLFADDCVYERPGYDPFEGREALERFYSGQRKIVAGAHTLTALVRDGGSVAVEGHFDGTLNDDSQVRVRFADFFTVRDGRIQERRTYFYEPSV